LRLVARREDRVTPFCSDSEEDAAEASSNLEETRRRREGDGGEETAVKERGGDGARVVRAVVDDGLLPTVAATPKVELGFEVWRGGEWGRS
jgi:hypothetical protein